MIELDVSGAEARICREIAYRQKLGIAKYGQTVDQNPLSLIEWLQHAKEESLDFAVYCEAAIAKLRSALDDSK